MSIQTSQRLNADQVTANLPPGASFDGSGAPLNSTGAKTLTPHGTDDATLQAAVTTAAAQFVDYDVTRTTLLNSARNALANNAAYLALSPPTQAQVVAQVAALTRQVDALIRYEVGDFSSLS